MKAGIYVRISQDRESEEHGIDRQERDARTLAKQRGWTVVDVFADNDVSATSGRRRPEWERLLADLASGRIDAVVAYSSSRMYRRPRDLERLVKLNPPIATVVSGTINLDTADGRMMAGILAQIDQAEAERLGERVRRSKADRAAAGTWLGGGRRPYGYDRIAEPDEPVRHVVNRAEAAIIRETVRRALRGEALGRIVADLNARGVTTASGKRWRPAHLRRLHRSTFHAGLTPSGKRGNWPRIVTPDQHRLLLAKFPPSANRGRGKGSREAAVKYALSGIASCGDCGSRMLGSGGYYRCTIRNGGCGRVSIRVDPVDLFVEERLYARAEADEAEDRTVDAGPIGDELAAAEERLAAARVAYADGDLTLEDFKVARGRVEARIVELRERLATAVPDRPSRTFLREWLEAGAPNEERGPIDPAELRALARMCRLDAVKVARRSSDRSATEPVSKRVKLAFAH
ncbi:MAG: recombinase family protein [Actinomycetota bacterium]